MIKQLLLPLFGGPYVNICAKAALRGRHAAAGLPLTARASRWWSSSLKSSCANFLCLMMMAPNYARAVAMSSLMYDS